MPISPAVNSALRKKLEEVLAPIRLLPAHWFSATFPGQVSIGTRTRLLESISETEIWKCSGEYCRGCPGTEMLGCILGASTPTGYGVVALIHPCLYGEGRCTRADTVDLWAERFIVSAIFYKLGLVNDARPLKKYQEASSAWLRKTANAVNDALGSCPGPYKEKTITFLRENELVSLPNSALRTCAEKYLEALRSLPGRCPIFKKELKESWDPFFKKNFRKTPEILRCGPFCRRMLCRGKGSTTVFTLVGTTPTLFLLDGACEGEVPSSIDRFFMSVLPQQMKALVNQSHCLSKVGNSNPGEPAAESEGKGPEIQLIDQ